MFCKVEVSGLCGRGSDTGTGQDTLKGDRETTQGGEELAVVLVEGPEFPTLFRPQIGMEPQGRACHTHSVRPHTPWDARLHMKRGHSPCQKGHTRR